MAYAHYAVDIQMLLQMFKKSLSTRSGINGSYMKLMMFHCHG